MVDVKTIIQFGIISKLASLFQFRGQLESSVAEEKRYNPRLTKDISTFEQIMANLNLPKPKMIGEWDCYS